MNKPDTTKRVPLVMIGTFWKGKHKFTITRSDVAQMAENLRKRGGDVVMDYEHASEFPEVAQGQPIPAAGWITGIDDHPDSSGIVWGEVKFTPRALALISNEEYRYVSPVIDWGFRDKKDGTQQGATLTSAALTNRPVLDQMPAISLSGANHAAIQGLAVNLFQDTAERLGMPYEEAAKAVLRDYPALAAKLFIRQ